MKLSKKADYALRALFSLLESRDQGPIPMNKLARTNDIPKKFLEHIMLDLKRAGWVASVPGRRGGYYFCGDPTEISMGQVVRLYDGVLAPIACVSVHQYSPCSQEGTCRFRRVLLEIRNMTSRHMDNASLADVFAGRPVDSREVFAPEFLFGEGI